MGEHRHHLGDDLPGLAQHHPGPHADVLLRDEILVVEGGPADGSARQGHGLKTAGGGKHAGAAHVHLDIQQGGLFLLRGVLESLGPPGELGGAAQLFPLGEVIDLDNSPVDGEVELTPLVPDLLDEGEDLLHIPGGAVQGRHGKAQLPKPLQGLVVAGEGMALHLLDVEDKDAQFPLGGDLRVLLAQGARRSVAGVFKRLLLQQLLPGAEALEALVGHVHLAPDLQKWDGLPQDLGHGADSADVLRHILAGDAVPPGGAPDKQAVPVLQGHGEPVELGLRHILHVPHGLPHPAVKIPQFLLGEGIVEALQGHLVDHLGKGVVHRPANFLRGGIRRDQFGILPLQGLQLAVELVILKVADLRVVLRIIFPAVVADLLPQLRQPALCFLFFHSFVPSIDFPKGPFPAPVPPAPSLPARWRSPPGSGFESAGTGNRPALSPSW